MSILGNIFDGKCRFDDIILVIEHGVLRLFSAFLTTAWTIYQHAMVSNDVQTEGKDRLFSITIPQKKRTNNQFCGVLFLFMVFCNLQSRFHTIIVAVCRRSHPKLTIVALTVFYSLDSSPSNK